MSDFFVGDSSSNKSPLRLLRRHLPRKRGRMNAEPECARDVHLPPFTGEVARRADGGKPSKRDSPKKPNMRGTIAWGFFVAGLLAAGPVLAQTLSLDLGSGEGVSGRAVQLVALITILSLAPSILIMTTSFVRIVVVLSLLRTAIGLQQAPPNSVIISLSLFLTLFVMAPTWTKAYDNGVKPLMNGDITLEQAWPEASGPVKQFMLAHVRDKDLALFVRLSKIETPKTAMDTPFQVVAPAFMISELKRAFEIGFLLFLPFLVVSSLLMSLGMMMLPPASVSLPFKLIFFVLVDGWRMIAGSLVESFSNGPPPG
jgi:flagellar biosynthesis protein FliP